MSGGETNGISNYNVIFTNATTATVTFDIAADATIGNRDIVLINPDGQMVTVVDAFTVEAPVTLGRSGWRWRRNPMERPGELV